jgi:hypothetical protein
MSFFKFINRISTSSKGVWKEYSIHQQRCLCSLTMDKLILVLQQSWTIKAFLCAVLSKDSDTQAKNISRKNN